MKKHRILSVFVFIAFLLQYIPAIQVTAAETPIEGAVNFTNDVQFQQPNIYKISWDGSTTPLVSNGVVDANEVALKDGEKIGFDINFNIPDVAFSNKYKAGDYFEVDIQVENMVFYPILDEQGKPMAKSIFDASGNVVFQYYLQQVSPTHVKVIFTLTEVGAQYDYYNNGKAQVLGYVDWGEDTNTQIIINNQTIDVTSMVEPISETEEPKNNDTVPVPVLPNAYPSIPNLYKVGTAVVDRGYVSYKLNVNAENLDKYYKGQPVNEWAVSDVVVVDTLTDAQVFDTSAIGITGLLSRPGYNDAGEIEGMAPNSHYYISVTTQFERLYQESDESNEQFLKRIADTSLSYGFSNDKKSFSANFGNIPGNGISVFGSDQDILNYFSGNTFQTFYAEEMMQFYGSDSESPFSPVRYIVYLKSDITDLDQATYQNTATLTYRQSGSEMVIPSAVSLKNLTYIASVQPGDNGTVTLLKYDLDIATLPIEGATFILERQNDEGVYVQYGGALQTNKDGMIIFEDVISGTYRLIETAAAPGYDVTSLQLQSGDAQTVLLEDMSFVVTQEDANGKVLYATNKRVPLSIDISKYDEATMEVIEGASFELQQFTSEEWVVVDTYTSDKEGNIHITNDVLTEGQYRLYEVEAASEYDVDSAIYAGEGITQEDQYAYFVLDYEQSPNATIHVSNDRLVKVKGISTTDSTIKESTTSSPQTADTTNTSLLYMYLFMSAFIFVFIRKQVIK